MQEQIRLGPWFINVDREATRDAYRRASGSSCHCSGCRNFRRVREHGFPAALLEIFEQFGVDPTKESEVYELGRVEESAENLVAYGGWHHIVGEIENHGGDAFDVDPNWKLWFSEEIALAEPSFRRFPLVQVEIDARIPWVLKEPCPL